MVSVDRSVVAAIVKIKTRVSANKNQDNFILICSHQTPAYNVCWYSNQIYSI